MPQHYAFDAGRDAPDDDLFFICQAVRERRTQLGLTMEELADIDGCKKNDISTLESGTRANMLMRRFLRLAKSLKVHPAFLLFRDPESVKITVTKPSGKVVELTWNQERKVPPL